MSSIAVPKAPERPSSVDLGLLQRIQARVLWLSTYLIHYANHIRPNPDSIKVGGHQASSASVVTMLTAYYFAAAEAGDLIAIKPPPHRFTMRFNTCSGTDRKSVV